MSDPGSLPALLAFVPNWWQETTNPTALATILTEWAGACGWLACGLAWADETTTVVRTVRNGVPVDGPAPTEVPDALRRLRGGEVTVASPAIGTSNRVFAGIQPPGRAMGVLWVERAGSPLTEAERAAVAMTAKVAERSPAVAALVPTRIDADRLDHRLTDAALIAGRMAHDFDNILTGIIGFSDLATPLLPAGSQAAKFVAEISKVGQRGIVFTQQLHQLSRSGQVKPNPTAVAAVVAKEETRLKALSLSNHYFEKDVPANLPPVAIEAGLLQATLAHLIENGIEASPQGGTVRVAAHVVELSDADARDYLGRPGTGPHLLVTIADTGTGIKPEVRRRLFLDPFYTTKVRHRGLGLAIVYRVLCVHKGGIQIEPARTGPGTLVRVVLPLAPARPATTGTPPTGPASATVVRG